MLARFKVTKMSEFDLGWHGFNKYSNFQHTNIFFMDQVNMQGEREKP